jgi:hypothetical protein
MAASRHSDELPKRKMSRNDLVRQERVPDFDAWGPGSGSFRLIKEAKAWYDSPAYREVRKHRFLGADYSAVIVEGV